MRERRFAIAFAALAVALGLLLAGSAAAAPFGMPSEPAVRDANRWETPLLLAPLPPPRAEAWLIPAESRPLGALPVSDPISDPAGRLAASWAALPSRPPELPELRAVRSARSWERESPAAVGVLLR